MGRRQAFTSVAVAAILFVCSCRRAAEPPPTPASIVIVTIDTLRPDHVTSRLMPHLTTLAREAIVSENALTVAPLTLPAHASLLTGAYPPRHSVRDNHVFVLPQSVPGFPSWLKERGYATAAFVSAVVLDRRYGLDRGFDVYDDAMTGPEPARRGDDRSRAAMDRNGEGAVLPLDPSLRAARAVPDGGL